MEVFRYATASGRDVLGLWFAEIADVKARARVAARLDRLSFGNFGDCKPVRDGVWELRIDFGPGYRVYYARTGRTVILLLCGGTKRTQSGDIKRAVTYWEDYQDRVGGK